MLERLNDGYRPSLEEEQGYYLSLAVFKNVLGSAPYQEVLLTTTGTTSTAIERHADGRLEMAHLARRPRLDGDAEPWMCADGPIDAKTESSDCRRSVSYLDFKQLEMDRVLTAFFARLAHNGFPSRLERKVRAVGRELRRRVPRASRSGSRASRTHREILERWVETHLIDVVNRGKAEPGGRGAAPAARLHLPLPQPEALARLRRGAAPLRDALRRAEGRRAEGHRAPQPLLLPGPRQGHGQGRRRGGARRRDPGAPAADRAGRGRAGHEVGPRQLRRRCASARQTCSPRTSSACCSTSATSRAR